MLNALTFNQLTMLFYGVVALLIIFLISIICLCLSNRKIGKKNQLLSEKVESMKLESLAKNDIDIESLEKSIIKKSVDATLNVLGLKY